MTAETKSRQLINWMEVDSFVSDWCYQCERARYVSDGNGCEIIDKVLALLFDDTEIPEEWRYDDEDDLCCMVFEPRFEPSTPLEVTP
jgi:hypothetical protein